MPPADGSPLWGKTPRQSITIDYETHGHPVVVQACIDLLERREVDPGLVKVLGGPQADRYLDSAPNAYWLRVWRARGLLWAWDDVALPTERGRPFHADQRRATGARSTWSVRRAW